MIDFNSQMDANANEPIALVGMGCRLPGGVRTWQDYWRLLANGVDAITQVPEDRWDWRRFHATDPAAPGKSVSRWGGFVEGIDRFDPQLFGISPREAAAMDPQQRMLLEVAYRAVEDAGQPLDRLAGAPVSVFVGISSIDFSVASLSLDDRGIIDAYSNTGGSASIAANRISYCFDLRGPSVAVDTACSSSLVALHMACESLWRGEATMALAGGVNALLLPDFYVAFSRLGVLSPDGRCKSFDARANGYVRSEGAGMVLLKPLSAAMAARDPIYAVIRATALNQDGRTPGMTVPAGEAQQELMREACRRAAIEPAELSYVEAHGTGTSVGDPIEANAVAKVVAQGRSPEEPCWLGSVKTNIGHLEAGAGVAGVMKVALALHHRQIPPHLHFQKPNPEIDFDHLPLRIPTRLQPWQSSGPRLAGVNGFGYGGANAHVILEEAPEEAAEFFATALLPSNSSVTSGVTSSASPPQTSRSQQSGAQSTEIAGRAGASHPQGASESPRQACFQQQAAAGGNDRSTAHQQPQFNPPVVLPLSARSEAGLRQWAGELADWLQTQQAEEFTAAEVAAFWAHRRSQAECRQAIQAADRASLVEQLRCLALSDEGAKENACQPLETPLAASELAVGPAFICSGQGPQWWAMGRELLRFSPRFREVIRRCDREFCKYVDWSLIEELSRDESSSRMQETRIAQPSLFALQIGLAAVWESWGVRPSSIVGHSVGEIAAGYLSGALSFSDAACVAIHRGRTMDLASSRGGMLAVGLSPSEVASWIDGLEDELAIAAINGPTSVTISGAANRIQELAERLQSEGVFCRVLSVEYAFHSPQMNPVQDELLRSLSHIQPRAGHTRMISTVTGREIDGSQLDAEYWWRNVRESVRFSDAMMELAELGHALAIEISPHPVLAFSINECFQQAGSAVRCVPSLNRKQNDLHCMTQSLSKLYSWGCDIDWSGFYVDPPRKIPVPLYPFQHQSLWSEPAATRRARLQPQVHPLLGTRGDGSQLHWQQRVDLRLHRYLEDHRVRSACVYPAAAMIETALAAASQIQQAASQPGSTVPQPAAGQEAAVDQIACGLDKGDKAGECASNAGSGGTAFQPIRLEAIRFRSACVLTSERPQWIETRYDAPSRQIKLVGRDCSGGDWNDLAEARYSQAVPLASQLERDWASVFTEADQRCRQNFDSTDLYGFCQGLGLEYGAAFRGVHEGRYGVADGKPFIGESLIELDADRLPEVVRHSADEYFVHPALLDSCFHTMIAADPDFDQTLSGLYLPAEVSELILFRPLRGRLVVHTRVRSKNEQNMRADVTVYDNAGRICLAIRDFVSTRVQGGDHRQRLNDLLYSYSWKEDAGDSPPISGSTKASVATSSSAKAPNHWLIFADRGGFAVAVAEQLLARGEQITLAFHDLDITEGCSQGSQQLDQGDVLTKPQPLEVNVSARLSQLGCRSRTIAVEDASKYQAAFKAFVRNARTDRDDERTADASQTSGGMRLLYCWGLDAPELASGSDAGLARSTLLTAQAPRNIVQAWESVAEQETAELVIVTAAAQPTETEGDSPVPVASLPVGNEDSQNGQRVFEPVQSSLIGFGRVVASEYTRFRTKLVDLPATAEVSEAASWFVRELDVADGEDEVLLRQGRRFVRRFLPQAKKSLLQDHARKLPVRLHVGDSASIEDLEYRTQQPAVLQGDEVEIEVRATGLNFSDVMKALDLYPGGSDASPELGAECSGVIVQAGPEAEFKVGDEVIAIARGAFATRLTVSSALVARKPRNMTFVEAAAIPIAFLTAHYAFNECARLRSGDSVLIHSASGGVGLAAMQLSRLARFRVFATAGTEEKREFVRQFGAEAVFDSRSLDFADGVRRATAGEGVDAVLNSLAGEAIERGLSVLKTAGRFLEIGKRDIYSDRPLHLAPMRNNLSLFAIDLDQLFTEQPKRMGGMLRELVARFERGELQPLPVREFPANRTQDAFRFMRQGKQIGKVVISYDSRPSHVVAGEYPELHFRSDSSYLLVGGAGGFGLEIARWMSRRGAGHIVLSSRRSQLTPVQSAVVSDIEACGCRVHFVSADVTDPQQVSRLFQFVDDNLPPLRGVFHTAMVLEDKLLVDLDAATLDRVLRPKMLGGWNLHQATLHRELDHFVLFSSLSSVFGHAGQANYSAANAFLDGLAHFRRTQGLPATAINWGHVGEVGYLAERSELGQRLERQGVLPFSFQQATSCLEYAMQMNPVQVSVLHIDWTRWRGLGITNRISPRFAHLLRQSDQSNEESSNELNAESLRHLSPESQCAQLQHMVRGKASSLLGIAANSIPDDRALIEMGLDSLMAVELRNWLESKLECTVPISALMRCENIKQLAQQLSQLLGEQTNCENHSLGALTEPPNSGLEQGKTSSVRKASHGVAEYQASNFETTALADADSAPEVDPSSMDAQQLLQSIDDLSDDQVSQLLNNLLREQH